MFNTFITSLGGAPYLYEGDDVSVYLVLMSSASGNSCLKPRALMGELTFLWGRPSCVLLKIGVFHAQTFLNIAFVLVPTYCVVHRGHRAGRREATRNEATRNAQQTRSCSCNAQFGNQGGLGPRPPVPLLCPPSFRRRARRKRAPLRTERAPRTLAKEPPSRVSSPTGAPSPCPCSGALPTQPSRASRPQVRSHLHTAYPRPRASHGSRDALLPNPPSVQKTAQDVASTVQTVDWRKELEALGTGVVDESHELQKEAGHGHVPLH